jgi:thymidylate synthase
MMSKFTTNHFYNILQEVDDLGEEVVSRGLKTREIFGYNYKLPPRVRFMCFDARKLKMDYVKQEFLWYLVGEPTDHSICKVASMWDGLINDDKSINSNYGAYIFNPHGGHKGISNFDRAAQTLKDDPQSRRAVMMILNSSHLNSKTKDYPCTVYINFLIRENQLHIFVRMRSQDAIFGMGNDAPFFSFVHELMFWTLKPEMPDLQLGFYYHSADSFHIYERHYDMVNKILENPVVTVDHHDACPPMTFMTPVYIGMLRRDLLSKNHNLDAARNDPFVKWLLEREDPNTLLMPDVK